ncbi:MAG TPA: hypothetical protein DCG57_21610 [Candidatus Riflebacteria bacterium]|nr:hypothetical protein [Candidatus Riflebacteria bacterium]
MRSEHEFEQAEKLHFSFDCQVFVPALGFCKRDFAATPKVFVQNISESSGNPMIFERDYIF